MQRLNDECPQNYINYNITSDNPNLEVENFESWHTKLVKSYFPSKSKCISSKRLKMPWVTNRVMKLIDKKHKVFILLKCRLMTYPAFKTYSNILQIVLKRLKREYFINKFKNNSNDCKITWKLMNNVLGQKMKHAMKEMSINDSLTSAPKKTADNFVDYFASIPLNIQAKL